MQLTVDRHPYLLAAGVTAVMVAIAVVGRVALTSLFPSLTLEGVSLVVNQVYVLFALLLVTTLGWWGNIRLTTRFNYRALVYMLPLVGLVLLPFAFGLAVPEIAIFDGQPLPWWAVVLGIAFGSALGAAISEELLYRGVLLRALESRGRVVAVVLTAVLFGVTHLTQLAFGAPLDMQLLSIGLVILPTGIALGALAFRLESIWPLIAWHFAVDIPNQMVAGASGLSLLATLALVWLAAAVGVWLLWQDRRTAVPDSDADVTTAVEPAD